MNSTPLAEPGFWRTRMMPGDLDVAAVADRRESAQRTIRAAPARPARRSADARAATAAASGSPRPPRGHRSADAARRRLDPLALIASAPSAAANSGSGASPSPRTFHRPCRRSAPRRGTRPPRRASRSRRAARPIAATRPRPTRTPRARARRRSRAIGVGQPADLAQAEPHGELAACRRLQRADPTGSQLMQGGRPRRHGRAASRTICAGA